MSPETLRELERVEVTVLVDNYTDLLLLQSTPVVKRAAVLPPNAFLAEHGFSCLIKTVDTEEHLFLLKCYYGKVKKNHRQKVIPGKNSEDSRDTMFNC